MVKWQALIYGLIMLSGIWLCRQMHKFGCLWSNCMFCGKKWKTTHPLQRTLVLHDYLRDKINNPHPPQNMVCANVMFLQCFKLKMAERNLIYKLSANYMYTFLVRKSENVIWLGCLKSFNMCGIKVWSYKRMVCIH